MLIRAPGQDAGAAPMARWAAVLVAFAEEPAGFGVRELARRLELPRSAVHRIVRQLVALGFLQGGGRTPYRVGPELLRLASLVMRQLDVRTVARPVMEELVARHNETAMLLLYDERRRQFVGVDSVESTHPVRCVTAFYNHGSLEFGASGKAILAFLPPAEAEAILAEGSPDPITGRTLANPAALRRDLAAIRRRGYALSYGERFEGVVGVAAPIFNSGARVIGDLVLIVPSARWTAAREADLGRAVRDAADRVSRALGHAPTAAPARVAGARERDTR